MTRVLVDTSAYAAFKRGHPEVKLALQQAEEIYLNPVILAELFAGFARGSRKKENQRELLAFRSSPRVRTVDVTEATSARYAFIQNSLWTAGTPVPTNDIWIAASAMEHGLKVLTTDTYYRKIPQILADCHLPD